MSSSNNISDDVYNYYGHGTTVPQQALSSKNATMIPPSSISAGATATASWGGASKPSSSSYHRGGAFHASQQAGGTGGGTSNGGHGISNNMPTDQGKIFVGGLSWQTTEESLRWHFEQYGAVTSVELMKDRVTGDPRGFGFVTFRDPSAVDLVMAETAGHEVNHKFVDVKRAQARGVAPPSIHEKGGPPAAVAAAAAPPVSAPATIGGASVSAPVGASVGAAGAAGSTGFGNSSSFASSSQQQHQQHLTPEQLHNKVFVGGIPPHVDRDELKQIFSQFGAVVDAIVMLDQQTMRSRGFGFVTFENGSNGAQRAIEAQPVPVHGRQVEVKLATPRAEQKRIPPAGPKHLGLRAGLSSTSSAASSSEYAGLAVAYGRSGWKAGYGSKAFGQAGWAVVGWDDGGAAPKRMGFSFSMLKENENDEPPAKRLRTSS